MVKESISVICFLLRPWILLLLLNNSLTQIWMVSSRETLVNKERNFVNLREKLHAYCNHMVAWNDFKVLGRESNHWLLEIKDSLFIKRDTPSLNKNIYSYELFLFLFNDVRYKTLIAFICCYWIRCLQI